MDQKVMKGIPPIQRVCKAERVMPDTGNMFSTAGGRRAHPVSKMRFKATTILG